MENLEELASLCEGALLILQKYYTTFYREIQDPISPNGRILMIRLQVLLV
jgi:hypothetical protein